MSDSPFPSVDYDAWRQRVERELGDADFDGTLATELPDGITVQPLYHRHSTEHRQPRARIDNELGWFLTSRYETADPGEVRAFIADDLAGGATALWLRLDRAARSGIEADGRAEDDFIAHDGVAAYHCGDLEAALAQAQLHRVALMLDAGANTLPVTAAFLCLLDGIDLDPSAVELHLCCDPLAALAGDGALPAKSTVIASEMAQLVRFCEAKAPMGTALAISDLPYHSAGASPVQELGIAAATLVTYLRWLESAGTDPAAVLPYILLRSAVDRDLFVGIAKQRALRTLWNKIAGASGVAVPPPAMLHCVTSDRPLTRRAPWVNILRTTSQTAAAATGGADFVTSAAWDRQLGKSSPDARRLARNTQSILGEEGALGQVLDPAGGSHYVEELTDQLARGAWDFLQAIEAQGGALEALLSGWLPDRIAESRERRAGDIAEGRVAITGVTEFADDDEVTPRRELFDHEFAADRALERLREHRDQRLEEPDPDRDCGDLSELVRLAGTGATFGELSRALRRPPGETITPLPRFRDEEAAT